MKVSAVLRTAVDEFGEATDTKTPVTDFQAFGNISDEFTMKCIYTEKQTVQKDGEI